MNINLGKHFKVSSMMVATLLPGYTAVFRFHFFTQNKINKFMAISGNPFHEKTFCILKYCQNCDSYFVFSYVIVCVEVFGKFSLQHRSQTVVSASGHFKTSVWEVVTLGALTFLCHSFTFVPYIDVDIMERVERSKAVMRQEE